MAYIGASPPATALTASDISDGIISEAKMANDAISLTELKAGTDGEVISWDASGNPVAIAVGTSGHFLKSQGAGSQPVFAAAGGGKLLQVVQTVKTDTDTTTSSSYADISGLSRTITPTAASSKILICCSFAVANDGGLAIQCQRDVDSGGYSTITGWSGNAAGSRHRSIPMGNYSFRYESFNSQYLDTPTYSLTDVITYKFQWTQMGSGTLKLNLADNDADSSSHARGCSTITLMEIGA